MFNLLHSKRKDLPEEEHHQTKYPKPTTSHLPSHHLSPDTSGANTQEVQEEPVTSAIEID